MPICPTMPRRLLRSICCVLAGVVFFAQWAVAAYACPALSTAATATMQMTSTADCEDMAAVMDPEFASLCAAHCHQGQQSDHASTVTVPAALLSVLYLTPQAAEPVAAPRPAADATSALVAASPPRAILHCCFRI